MSLETKKLLDAVRQEKWQCSDAMQHLTAGRLERSQEARELMKQAQVKLHEASALLYQAAAAAGKQEGQ